MNNLVVFVIFLLGSHLGSTVPPGRKANPWSPLNFVPQLASPPLVTDPSTGTESKPVGKSDGQESVLIFPDPDIDGPGK